jgi:predicted phage terminase large subunit-like protein
MQNACNIIESLYNKYICPNKIINFESNWFQQTFSEELKRRRLAVKELKTTKDKITRLTEYQLEFERGYIVFVSWAKNISILEEQLLTFPNARYDDLVDAMMFAILQTKVWRGFVNGK